MSRQSDAKLAQQYEPKPTPNTCCNCGHFQSEMILPTWMVVANRERGGRYGETHKREANLRCGLGDFAVKKSGTCRMFSEPVST